MEIDLDDYCKIDRDVRGGDILTLADAGTKKASTTFANPDGSPKVAYEFRVILPDGKEKIATLNKTSLRNLANAWGTETNYWVGKHAIVQSMLTPQGKKAMVLTPKE